MSKDMALNLLFSRQRLTDESVRFVDVPVTEASIMVDALSFMSKFKRSAGWIYPIRPATNSDYERGVGRLLLFGKTRLVFPDFTPPYYLEFFPRFGVGNYILSVYTGEFEPASPSEWVSIPGGDWWVNYFPDEQMIRTRLGGFGSQIYDFRFGVSEAIVFGQGLFFSLIDGQYEKWLPYTGGSGGISVQEYLLIKSTPGTIVLS